MATVPFEQLPESARLWIYSASRDLRAEEIEKSQPLLEAFTSDWASHGSDLTAGSQWFDNHILVIGLDDSKGDVSGCGIDKILRMVKSLSLELSIELLDRMHVWVCTSSGVWSRMHFAEVKRALKSGESRFTHFADTTSKTKSEWLIGQCRLVKGSWLQPA